MASIACRQGRYEEAWQHYDHALALIAPPSRFRLEVARAHGRCLAKTGDVRGAIVILEQVMMELQETPEEIGSSYYVDLGNWYAAVKDWDGAESAYREGLDRAADGTDVKAQLQAGLERLGELREAAGR